MKVTIKVEKKDKYTFFKVEYQGISFGVRPSTSDYSLMEVLCEEKGQFELAIKVTDNKYDWITASKSGKTIRLFGEDWTATKILGQLARM